MANPHPNMSGLRTGRWKHHTFPKGNHMGAKGYHIWIDRRYADMRAHPVRQMLNLQMTLNKMKLGSAEIYYVIWPEDRNYLVFHGKFVHPVYGLCLIGMVTKGGIYYPSYSIRREYTEEFDIPYLELYPMSRVEMEAYIELWLTTMSVRKRKLVERVPTVSEFENRTMYTEQARGVTTSPHQRRKH